MAEVRLSIAGRDYAVACRDGEEEHLRQIGSVVDRKASDALRAVGGATEVRTLLLAALLLADENADLKAGAPPPPVDPGLATALVRLAERVERLADGLSTP